MSTYYFSGFIGKGAVSCFGPNESNAYEMLSSMDANQLITAIALLPEFREVFDVILLDKRFKTVDGHAFEVYIITARRKNG